MYVCEKEMWSLLLISIFDNSSLFVVVVVDVAPVPIFGWFRFPLTHKHTHTAFKSSIRIYSFAHIHFHFFLSHVRTISNFRISFFCSGLQVVHKHTKIGWRLCIHQDAYYYFHVNSCRSVAGRTSTIYGRTQWLFVYASSFSIFT